MVWTRDGSKACDAGKHDECDGSALWVEQDGYRTYRCGCYCHRALPDNTEG